MPPKQSPPVSPAAPIATKESIKDSLGLRTRPSVEWLAERERLNNLPATDDGPQSAPSTELGSLNIRPSTQSQLQQGLTNPINHQFWGFQDQRASTNFNTNPFTKLQFGPASAIMGPMSKPLPPAPAAPVPGMVAPLDQIDKNFASLKSIKLGMTVTERNFSELATAAKAWVTTHEVQCSVTPRLYKMPLWKVVTKDFIDSSDLVPTLFSSERPAFNPATDRSWETNKLDITFLVFALIKYYAVKLMIPNKRPGKEPAAAAGAGAGAGAGEGSGAAGEPPGAAGESSAAGASHRVGAYPATGATFSGNQSSQTGGAPMDDDTIAYNLDVLNKASENTSNSAATGHAETKANQAIDKIASKPGPTADHERGVVFHGLGHYGVIKNRYDIFYYVKQTQEVDEATAMRIRKAAYAAVAPGDRISCPIRYFQNGWEIYDPDAQVQLMPECRWRYLADEAARKKDPMPRYGGRQRPDRALHYYNPTDAEVAELLATPPHQLRFDIRIESILSYGALCLLEVEERGSFCDFVGKLMLHMTAKERTEIGASQLVQFSFVKTLERHKFNMEDGNHEAVWQNFLKNSYMVCHDRVIEARFEKQIDF